MRHGTPGFLLKTAGKYHIRMLCLFICGLLPVMTGQFVASAQYPVSGIIIEHLSRVRTHRDILIRELTFREGDTLQLDRLDSLKKVNEDRLFNMRLFNRAALRFDTTDRQLICYIDVQERFPVWPDPNFTLGDRNFNVWASEHHFDWKRVNVGLKLSHLNLWGRRIQLGVLYQTGYTEKMGIDFTQPFADKNKRHGWGWNIYRSANKETGYITTGNKLKFYRDFNSIQYREVNTELFYTYRPAFALQHRLGIRYTRQQVSDTILKLNPYFFTSAATRRLDLLQLSYRVEYNGVDNWNYPLTGWRIVTTARYSRGLNENFNQLDLHFQGDYYQKLGRKLFFAWDLKTRIAFQNTYSYFYSRNLGYENDYIRGYEYYVIDGQFMAYSRQELKYELLHRYIHLPLRFFETVPVRLYPKIFADLGYSRDRYTDGPVSNRLLYSAGIGLDLVTLYDIKVRFEFTWNHLREKDLYIHRKGN